MTTYLLCWSEAPALIVIRQSPSFSVVGLIPSPTDRFQHMGVHLITASNNQCPYDDVQP